MPCIVRRRRRDHSEQRRVDAVRSGGENADLPAFLAAIDQELPRVLEVVAINHFAQDAFGRDGSAIRRQHQGDFALRHNRHRHLDDAVLPRPIAEMQSRREHVRLQTRLALQGDQMSRRQRRVGEAFDHDAHLAFADQHTLERDDTERQRQRNQYQANPNQISPNMMFVIITHLRCGCARDAVYRRARTHATRFIGETVGPAHAEPRGSPFQMPTRLADGLGPESDPRWFATAFAPSPVSAGFGSPALACRKASQLRLLQQYPYHSRHTCQMHGLKVWN